MKFKTRRVFDHVRLPMYRLNWLEAAAHVLNLVRPAYSDILNLVQGSHLTAVLNLVVLLRHACRENLERSEAILHVDFYIAEADECQHRKWPL
jgi:hypothetical protein